MKEPSYPIFVHPNQWLAGTGGAPAAESIHPIDANHHQPLSLPAGSILGSMSASNQDDSVVKPQTPHLTKSIKKKPTSPPLHPQLTFAEVVPSISGNTWIHIVGTPTDATASTRLLSVATLRCVSSRPEPGLPAFPHRAGYPHDDRLAGVLGAQRGSLIPWLEEHLPEDNPGGDLRELASRVVPQLRALWEFVCTRRDRCLGGGGDVAALLARQDWRLLFRVHDTQAQRDALMTDLAERSAEQADLRSFSGFTELVFETYEMCVLVPLCSAPLVVPFALLGREVPFLRTAHDAYYKRPPPEPFSACVVVWPAVVLEENDHLLSKHAKALVLPLPGEKLRPEMFCPDL